MIGLGILAAGAAQGAANASNMNVQAQNQLEMEQGRQNHELRRDAIREEFLNKTYQQSRSDQLTDRNASFAREDQVYGRNRDDKLADVASQQNFQRETLGITEGNEMKRHNDRMGILRDNQKASSISDGDQVTKAQSPIGKEAEDYKRTGVAKTNHEAYRLAAMNRASEIIMANPLNSMKSLPELVASIKDYASQLYPDINNDTGSAPTADTIDYMLDPKSGQLINKRAASVSQSQPEAALKGSPTYEDLMPHNIPMNVVGEHGLQHKDVNSKTGVSVDHKSGYLILNRSDPKTGKMATIKLDPVTGNIVES